MVSQPALIGQEHLGVTVLIWTEDVIVRVIWGSGLGIL